MPTKKAIVVGSKGQDGILMTNYLRENAYEVFEINKDNFDISNKTNVNELINDLKPSEIYYFAAFHRSSQDNIVNFSEDLIESINANSIYPVFFLDAINNYSKKSKFFYASSTLIFSANENKINEESPISPKDPYSISKYVTMQSIKAYRKKGVFASCGILSNHESIYRKDSFLSKRIVNKAVDALYGNNEKMIIGDINSYADWSYAPDFMKIIFKIMHHKVPDDFILASGKLHQVKDFLEFAFSEVNLNYQDFIEEDNRLLKRSNVKRKLDISKINESFNLDFITSFKDMIKILIQDEIKHRKK